MTILLVVNTFAQVKTTKKAAPKAKETSQESITISQFERAGESDFLIDQNNHYHVVFQESPAIGKPVFIYYTMSTNNGVSWSKPITLSNDGTGNGASPPSLIQDGNGAIYAIWKRQSFPRVSRTRTRSAGSWSPSSRSAGRAGQDRP